MKKISKMILGLFVGLLFAGCSNGSDDTSMKQLLYILENTPDAPIERNVELTNVSEMNIVKGQSYNLSDKEGKKVFMVVMNKSNYTETVFSSNNSVSSDINYDYKFQTENGVLYNVPFDPVCHENNPIKTSVPSSRSAIGYDSSDVQLPTT